MFENSSKIVIVMEYASRGDLYDYISERQRLSEREARHFFRQIVSAVHYCHQVSGTCLSPVLRGWSLGLEGWFHQRDFMTGPGSHREIERGKTQFWTQPKERWCLWLQVSWLGLEGP